MKTYFDTIAKFFGPYFPAPEYLARVMVDAINKPSNDPENRLLGAGSIKMHTNEDKTLKTGIRSFVVKDKAGFLYRVTVEVIDE